NPRFLTKSKTTEPAHHQSPFLFVDCKREAHQRPKSRSYGSTADRIQNRPFTVSAAAAPSLCRSTSEWHSSYPSLPVRSRLALQSRCTGASPKNSTNRLRRLKIAKRSHHLADCNPP